MMKKLSNYVVLMAVLAAPCAQVSARIDTSWKDARKKNTSLMHLEAVEAGTIGLRLCEAYKGQQDNKFTMINLFEVKKPKKLSLPWLSYIFSLAKHKNIVARLEAEAKQEKDVITKFLSLRHDEAVIQKKSSLKQRLCNFDISFNTNEYVLNDGDMPTILCTPVACEHESVKQCPCENQSTLLERVKKQEEIRHGRWERSGFYTLAQIMELQHKTNAKCWQELVDKKYKKDPVPVLVRVGSLGHGIRRLLS